MNTLNLVDNEITAKILELLNLELPRERNTLVILVKRYIHSLGSEFLNIETTLFTWDQLFLKFKKNKIEIYFSMAVTLHCLKSHIISCTHYE